MDKIFTLELIKSHNKEDDVWFIVDGNVYDGSKFFKEHPGGAQVFLKAIQEDPDISERIKNIGAHQKKMDAIGKILEGLYVGKFEQKVVAN